MFKRDKHWSRYRVSQPTPSRSSAGFTLVELLVVIAIIGILIGLTMPAVMSAIESARRTQCANNMKNIALAANQYETSQRQYPLNWGQVTTVATPSGSAPGSVTVTASAPVGVSWLAALLPNLDSGPLYGTAALGQDLTLTSGQTGYGKLQSLGYVNTSTGISNPQVLATVVPTFLCPSDTQRGTIGNQVLGGNSTLYATTNYKACAGSNWGASSFSATGTSGSVGRNSGNTDGLDHGNGVICRGGATTAGGAPIQTSNMDIRDGASKTFLLGESVPAWCGWSLWFWFESSTATCGVPLNYSVPGKTLDTNYTDWKDTFGFMSRHKQGANFAACDGSVHFIPNVIDFYVYQALATIDGNESVTTVPPDVSPTPVDWP